MMEPIFNDIHQIGIVANNVKENIKSYTKNYGIGLWNVWKFNSDMVEDMEVRGRKIDYSMMVATCKSGNIDREIIEPLDNKSIFSEFYNKYGEGLQHVDYKSGDYNKTIEYLKKSGVKVIQHGNLVGKYIYIFLGTDCDAKHIIETYTNLPSFIREKPLLVYPKDNEEGNKIKLIFRRIEQIGIVVKDIKKTAAILENKYTLGPWEFFKLDPITVDDMFINGKRENHTFNIAICKIGKAKLKLVKPNDEKAYFQNTSQNLVKGFIIFVFL